MSTFDYYAEDFSGAAQVFFDPVTIDALDFERAKVALNTLAGYIEEMQPIMQVAKNLAREDMKKRFDHQIAPDGEEWVDLDPDYAARKEHEAGFVYPILTRGKYTSPSGRENHPIRLRDAATDEAAWSVSGESIFFSTEFLPPYWKDHQEGKEFGTHFHGGLGAKTNQAGEHIVSKQSSELTTSKGSGDANLPARPFIGISQEGAEEIVSAFDRWWGTGIENFKKNYGISSHGVLQERVSGRFGSKIIL